MGNARGVCRASFPPYNWTSSLVKPSWTRQGSLPANRTMSRNRHGEDPPADVIAGLLVDGPPAVVVVEAPAPSLLSFNVGRADRQETGVRNALVCPGEEAYDLDIWVVPLGQPEVVWMFGFFSVLGESLSPGLAR